MEENEITDRIYDTLMGNTKNPQFPLEEVEDQWVDSKENIISFRIGNNDYNIIVKKVFVGKNE